MGGEAQVVDADGDSSNSDVGKLGMSSRALEESTARRKSGVTIRFATVDDVDALLEIGAIAHKETVYAGLPFDRGRAQKACLAAITAPKGKSILIAERRGRIIGLLAGMAEHHFFSEAIGATCIMFYVLPEHRGSLAAVKLLHGFRRWAGAHGAERLYVNVTSGLKVVQTDRLLKRLGFRQVSGNYVL